MKNKGQSLVSVLVAVAVTSLFMMSLLILFKTQNRATRQIAAKEGVNDLSHGLDVLFSSSNCATTGYYLVGGVNGQPAVVSVAGGAISLSIDTIEFPNGTGTSNGAVAITSTPNAILAGMIQPYTINTLAFTSLDVGSATGTGFEYPFQLTAKFTSPSGGPPPSPSTSF